MLIKSFRIVLLILQIHTASTFGQTTISQFGSNEKFNLNPKASIIFESNVVTPISLLKNDTSDIGLLFTDNQAKLIKAFRFSGKDKYVINQIIPGKERSILIAAEGYSKNNQESFYFIEFKNDKIVNSFVFNEGGNELDPFSIIENADQTITITGFVKKRELIGSFDFNMYKEDQFMYIAEFNKSGSKIWSKGIQFPNYTEPNATKIINAKNHNYILAYGKNNNFLVPKILKTSASGKIEKCIDFNTFSPAIYLHTIDVHNDTIWSIGTISSESSSKIIISAFDLSLKLISSSQVTLDNNISPSSLFFENNYLFLSGSLIDKKYSYDNFLLKFDMNNKNYQVKSWGSPKIERLISFLPEYCIGTITNPNNKFANYIEFFQPIDWANLDIKRSTNISLTYSMINKFTITTKFANSNINKGVGILNCVRIDKNIQSVK